MKTRYRYRCDHAGCPQTVHVDATDMASAHETAVDRGWEFYWGGAGHGWHGRCPRHPRFRFMFQEQAMEQAA